MTSSRVLPRQDVIPIPVTTTRRSAMERTVVVVLVFWGCAAAVVDVDGLPWLDDKDDKNVLYDESRGQCKVGHVMQM